MLTLSESLGGLAALRNHRSARVSSFDTTGGNADFQVIYAGEKKVIGDIEGPGIIRHIWVTLRSEEPAYLRRVVLRVFWDDESEPSVEVPIGDFFGLGHATTTYFSSLPLSERMDMLCYFTDLALTINPALQECKDAQPIAGRIQVISAT